MPSPVSNQKTDLNVIRSDTHGDRPACHREPQLHPVGTEAGRERNRCAGVSETEFLGELSDLIGTYDREKISASYNKGVRSTSKSLKRDKILEVQELADMPRGRAVMLSSGSRAVLLRTVPWYDGPNADANKKSIVVHEPRGVEVGRELVL